MMLLPEVIRGERTELRVFCSAEQVARFVHPAFGPFNYFGVGEDIMRNGLALPTGDLTAHLLYAACCVPESQRVSEFADVREKMQKSWLWLYQVNFWTRKGIYVVQDSESRGTASKFDVDFLEKLEDGSTHKRVRFSKDGTVRFAPESTYVLGEHTPESLANDGFVIASFGVEGAKALAQVANTFEGIIQTCGAAKRMPLPATRVSGVVGCIANGLCIGGDFAGGWDGYAFGILDAPKARR